MKLAIFLPNWIGDVVMATPALRSVRNRFPDAEIVGIMRPYVEDVLAGTGLIDRVALYNPRGKEATQRGIAFVQRLRHERFDTALLLTNSLRTASLAWLSGAKRRIGFSRDLRGWLLTDLVAPKSRKIPHPVLDEYLRLTEQLGCKSTSRRMELSVSQQDELAFHAFRERTLPSNQTLQKATIPHASESSNDTSVSGRPYVCLNTGGAFGAAKNWPRESFVDLARRIATELDRDVVIVCGPSERDDAEWIEATANHRRVVSLAKEKLSIGLTKAAIRTSELLVTTDSGPRHFASAFDVPVITLFGPTHAAWSETHSDKATHLQLKLDCGPCQKRECPLGHHRCMKDLSVETVFQSVRHRLTSTSETAHTRTTSNVHNPLHNRHELLVLPG